MDVVAVVAMKRRYKLQIVRTASEKLFQNVEFFFFLAGSQRIVKPGPGEGMVALTDQNGVVGIVWFSRQHFLFFSFHRHGFPFRGISFLCPRLR